MPRASRAKIRKFGTNRKKLNTKVIKRRIGSKEYLTQRKT